MIYRPDYVEKIMRYTDTSFVTNLTGVRRCGKFSILKMLWRNIHLKSFFTVDLLS